MGIYLTIKKKVQSRNEDNNLQNELENCSTYFHTQDSGLEADLVGNFMHPFIGLLLPLVSMRTVTQGRQV